ncbi:transcriptional regulator [Chelatococcus asaccharovorans]|jgi:transcriptional regulator with XRE-family HTH domain|uniref:transcriptional regulator n=1 Tax=Chelatococcus asaccharovorans TaxID=28210 RepID=UPI00224C7683|nr:Helix-turn-helix protein [Chelatococcus asaccharovorans]CAH1680645.1 Helix-turn-helix protein [Chelatococcus asaccharovorans]
MAGNKSLNDEALELRRRGGRWLRSLRENAGLSQRDLARLIDVEYYTFISQIEIGRGRIPTEKYAAWAKALNIDVNAFIVHVLQYYEPLIHKHLFADAGTSAPAAAPRETPIDQDHYLALKSEIRELQRLLGKKTLENELLREKLSQRNISLPQMVSAAPAIAIADNDAAKLLDDEQATKQRFEDTSA